MPIPIENQIKGRVSQTLAEILFERNSYRVTRLGIEELFREVKGLSEPEYKKLDLPMTLRHLPDLLVADKGLTKAWLVEVKFRKDISSIRQHFRSELENIRKLWPDAYVLICLANSPSSKSSYLQDHVRVITPEKDIEYIVGSKAPSKDKDLWDQLHRPSKIFAGFSETKADLDKILPIIKVLQTV